SGRLTRPLSEEVCARRPALPTGKFATLCSSSCENIRSVFKNPLPTSYLRRWPKLSRAGRIDNLRRVYLLQGSAELNLASSAAFLGEPLEPCSHRRLVAGLGRVRQLQCETSHVVGRRLEAGQVPPNRHLRMGLGNSIVDPRSLWKH